MQSQIARRRRGIGGRSTLSIKGRRRAAPAVVGVLIGLLALVCVASAQAWVHREGRWWSYYLPTPQWTASQNAAGVDISSPTGVLLVSYAFSQTPRSYSNDQVATLTANGHGLDSHPITSLRFTSASKYTSSGGWTDRTYQWTAVRTDLHQSVRGVLTTGVYSGAGTYGIRAFGFVAPASQFAKQASMLATTVSRIRYIPQS